MNEVSIPKGRLMAMQVGIVVLLIFVFVLSLKLRAEPKIPPDFGEFHRTLAQDTSAVATIIDVTGKVTPFDRKLSLLKSCGESEDRTFPASCRPEEGSDLLFKNVVTLMVYGNKENGLVTDFILGTGDNTYFLGRPQGCPGGTCCWPHCG